MAKGWQYWTKVGFHLFLVSILAMIVAAIVMWPISAILVGASAGFAKPIVAGWSLTSLIGFFIGCLILGYFVVRWKEWVFKDSII